MMVIWNTRVMAFAELFNSSLPGQNGRHFEDDIFIYIFLNENILILIQISLTLFPGFLDSIDIKSALD